MMSYLRTNFLWVFLLSFSHTVMSAPIFSPYTDLTINTHWSSEFQEMEPMDLNLIAKQHGLHALHLAFITDSGNCQPAWGGQATYSLADKWGTRLTDALAREGIETTIAFGGASGNDMSLNCDEKQLLDIFNQTVITYKAKKLDFDIENNTANVPKLISAITAFQQKNPQIKLSFTLPTLPEGLTAEGKDIVAQAAEAHLNFNVNLMTMDYGPAYTGDMGDYTKQAAASLHDYLTSLYPTFKDNELWQKIEVTPMIGVNDVNTEQFSLQNAKAVKEYSLTQKIGGFSMWSLTRDKACSDQWASPVCSGNNLQRGDFDYTHIFNK